MRDFYVYNDFCMRFERSNRQRRRLAMASIFGLAALQTHYDVENHGHGPENMGEPSW